MKRKFGTSQPSGSIDVRALILVKVASAAVVALTFRTWIDFNVAHLRGTDADAMTGYDGYIVIGLAAAAALCAGAVYLFPRYWAWLLPTIGAASLGIAAIAAYEAGTTWHVAGIDIHGAYVANGHATAAVYEVFALAVLIGLVASVLAAVQYQRKARAMEIDQATTEGTRHAQPNSRSAGRLRTR